jgi:hypothetical protein
MLSTVSRFKLDNIEHTTMKAIEKARIDTHRCLCHNPSRNSLLSCVINIDSVFSCSFFSAIKQVIIEAWPAIKSSVIVDEFCCLPLPLIWQLNLDKIFRFRFYRMDFSIGLYTNLNYRLIPNECWCQYCPVVSLSL